MTRGHGLAAAGEKGILLPRSIRVEREETSMSGEPEIEEGGRRRERARRLGGTENVERQHRDPRDGGGSCMSGGSRGRGSFLIRGSTLIEISAR